MADVVAALKVAKVKPDDVVYDLGCGDGRVVVAAAVIYKCKAVGVDIDPACVKKSQANVTLNNVGQRCTIVEGDILKVDFSKATVVYIYLQPELSGSLRQFIIIIMIVGRYPPHPLSGLTGRW